MGALTVACVKWGDRYSDLWVHRLQAMVKQHLSIQHRFVCLTDRKVPDVACRSLTSTLTGWWAKLELFQQLDGDVLYFDLDVVLTSLVDRIVDVARQDRSRLWMRDDFSYSLKRPRADIDPDTRRLLGGGGVCNSSVMAWNADEMRDVWECFTPDIINTLHGDQNYLTRLLWPGRIGLLPDDVVGSYKYGRMRNEPTAPVMVFHGKPKMDELPRSDPLRKLWEAA